MIAKSFSCFVIVWATVWVLSHSMKVKDSRILSNKIPKSVHNRSNWISQSAQSLLSDAEKLNWMRLLSGARSVFGQMMCQNIANNTSRTLVPEHLKTFVFLYTQEVATVRANLAEILSCPDESTSVTTWSFHRTSQRQQILQTLKSVLDMEKEVRGVIVASSQVNFIYLALNTVATHSDFKWRQFLHATEWFGLTIGQSNLSSDFLRNQSLPDFVTFLSIKKRNQHVYLDIMQKSRVQPLQTVLHIPIYPRRSKCFSQENLCTELSGAKNKVPSLPLNSTNLSKHMRQNAILYLSRQKSVMVHMQIPAVLVPSEADKTAFLVHENNETSWAGFNIAILDLLSESLGFTAQPFQVTDGGFYSVLKSNGDILGIVGYLSRRETGLSPMAIAITGRRLDVIGYLYPPIRRAPFYIMYRVNVGELNAGYTLSQMIQTSFIPGFLLIGSGVALTTGLVVYLTNGVFLTRNRICGLLNLRRLYNFPFIWIFQTPGSFRHHSARILRASWGLYCVVIFASCGALLTSHAAVPREYPNIASLEDLLAHPEFEIGTSPSNSYFFTSMREARHGTTLARLWKVLCQQNKTNPHTFSTDKSYHIGQALKGNYAFLGNVPIRLLPTFAKGDFRTMRFTTLHERTFHVTIPQNAFYKQDIERVLHSANEMGIIQSILYKWIPGQKDFQTSKKDDSAEMNLSRLKLLLYLIGYGTGFAFLGLIGEIILHIRKNNVFQWFYLTVTVR